MKRYVIECDCYYCLTGQPHPTRHTNYQRVNDLLLVAESLDPNDSIPVEACMTCGHTRRMLDE